MSDAAAPGFRSHLTLALCTLLHAFTHAYGTILVPLYLLIVSDLHLAGVNQAAILVTVYGLLYCLGSYGAGVLADRGNRKAMLGAGLMVNAAAILLMGLTRRYELLILLSVLAGLSGTLFHPAANALVTAHYPRAPGMAIGMLGIGAGIGFFAGPQYAGWRAQSAGGDWQRPLIEAGLFGVAFGAFFLLAAREVRRAAPRTAAAAHPPLGPTLRGRVLAVAALLSLRDFAGIATMSLASIYLQKAQGRTVKETGFILGAMMLIAIVVNPLLVWRTPGRRRLPALGVVLLASGVVLASVPYWPAGYVLAVLCAFQAFHLGSYALSEAAVLERVDPDVRGRVVGMFLTVAGTFASSAPWLMGAWTDALGGRASNQSAYAAPFVTVGVMIALAAAAIPFIARLGRAPATQRIEPVTQIVPATMEPTA